MFQRIASDIASRASNSAFQYAANALTGDQNNPDIDRLMSSIRNSLNNTQYYDILKNHLKQILMNYHFEKWTLERQDFVVFKLTEMIKQNFSMAENDIPSLIFAVSECVKLNITNEAQNSVLIEAIKNSDPMKVCHAIACGANAQKYVHLVISDRDKSHLLKIFLLAGVSPETTYNGMNLIAYAIDCNNEAAVDCLLQQNTEINISAFYKMQKERALQATIQNPQSRYNGGTALTVAIMNAKKLDRASSIGCKLIKAESSLNNIKTGLPHEYPGYNNLQLMVRLGLLELLKEALRFEDKSPSYQENLLSALTYFSQYKNESGRTAERIAELVLRNPELCASLQNAQQVLNLHLTATHVQMNDEQAANVVQTPAMQQQEQEQEQEQPASCFSHYLKPIFAFFSRQPSQASAPENNKHLKLE